MGVEMRPRLIFHRNTVQSLIIQNVNQLDNAIVIGVFQN